MPSAFPIALCGKNPKLASHFVQLMNKSNEFQVVTVFNTTAQATSELHSLLDNKPVLPLSGIGSNMHASPEAPKAIIVGAGFSSDEVDAMRKQLQDLPAAGKLAWFTPARAQPQRPGEPGFMESVVGRARDALTEQIKDDGEVEEGVHGF